MTKAYYFLFTSGDAWEFGVTAMGVSDYPIDAQQWQDHLQRYQEKLRKLQPPAQGDDFDAWYAAGGYDKLEKWKKRNEPHRTFARDRGIRLVRYTGLHDPFA